MQHIGELKLTFTHHKELWENMEKMDKHSFRRFRPDYSLQELTTRFNQEADATGK